jgi:hypothetical protein
MCDDTKFIKEDLTIEILLEVMFVSLIPVSSCDCTLFFCRYICCGVYDGWKICAHVFW